MSERAIVTAGFANEVDAVNQYADVMYAPTANCALMNALEASHRLVVRLPLDEIAMRRSLTESNGLRRRVKLLKAGRSRKKR